MNIKRFLALILSIMILCSFSVVAFAEDYTASNGYSYEYLTTVYDELLLDEDLNPHQYENVWDFADILTDQEEADLQDYAEQVKSSKGVETFYLTYEDTCGKSDTTFCDDFFDYYVNKCDFENEVDGVLYTINMYDRSLFTFVRGSYYNMLSNDEAYDLQNESLSYASDGDYYTYFVENNEVILSYLFPSNLSKIIPTTTSLIVSAVAIVIVILILFALHNRNNKAPGGQTYQTEFNVLNRNAVFMGHREEVIHDFYKQQSSGGGGGGGHSTGGGGHSGGGGGNHF